MSQILSGQTETVWWIAKSEDDSVIHYGTVDENNIVETGQPILESYNNENDWLIILQQLGVEL